MNYRIEKSRKRKRNIGIDYNDKNEIVLSFPYHFSQAKILAFIQKQSPAIEISAQKIVAKVLAQRKLQLSFVQGERIFFLGKAYFLEICQDDKISISDDKLRFPSVFLSKAKTSLALWFRSFAPTILFDRLAYLAEKYGFEYTCVKLSNAKTLWGVCNSRKEIKLNWRLIALDDSYRDYVILHELCHTLHFDHSPAFWTELTNVCPNCKTLSKQMRKDFDWVTKVL